MQQLTDRVAAVTGAGGGIGRALALRPAAEGMRLAPADNASGPPDWRPSPARTPPS